MGAACSAVTTQTHASLLRVPQNPSLKLTDRTSKDWYHLGKSFQLWPASSGSQLTTSKDKIWHHICRRQQGYKAAIPTSDTRVTIWHLPPQSPLGFEKKKNKNRTYPNTRKQKQTPRPKPNHPKQQKPAWKGKEQTLEHHLLLQHPPGRESPPGGISVPWAVGGTGKTPAEQQWCWCPPAPTCRGFGVNPVLAGSLKCAQCCCSSILQAAGGIWQASRPFNSSRQLPG